MRCIACFTLLFASSSWKAINALYPPTSCYRGIVTFDLDDCLWPINPVLSKANEAAEAAYGLSHKDVHVVMKHLRVAAELAGNGPLSYRRARIQAYKQLLLQQQEGGRLSHVEARIRLTEPSMGGAKRTPVAMNDEATAAALACFHHWLDARNQAGEQLLYPDVIPCLEELTKDGWLVGTITNGLGDPSLVPSLSPWVQFCVSGEDAGIFPHIKPARQIFEVARVSANAAAAAAAATTATATQRHQRLHQQQQQQKHIQQPWWHVGDDLVNDVAGAQSFGLKALLLQRPLHPTSSSLSLSTSPSADLSHSSLHPSSSRKPPPPPRVRNDNNANTGPLSTASPQEVAARKRTALRTNADLVLSSLTDFCGLIS